MRFIDDFNVPGPLSSPWLTAGGWVAADGVLTHLSGDVNGVAVVPIPVDGSVTVAPVSLADPAAAWDQPNTGSEAGVILTLGPTSDDCVLFAWVPGSPGTFNIYTRTGGGGWVWAGNTGAASLASTVVSYDSVTGLAVLEGQITSPVAFNAGPGWTHAGLGNNAGGLNQRWERVEITTVDPHAPEGGDGDWELFVADRSGTRIGQIDVYESSEVFGRVNDVSTWKLILPTDTEAGRVFTTDPFARLEVAFDHAVWRSGPMKHLERTVDMDGDMLAVTGVDDSIWLQRRLAHPDPSRIAPPYNAFAYDTHTGAVSTVLGLLADRNAGQAANSTRRVPGLVVPPPAPVGPTVTVKARWQNLLQLMQDTARPSGVIFDIVDLRFAAHMPVNRGAVFSTGLETLAAWKMVAEAPTANEVYTAGGGEGTARIIRRSRDTASVTTWGLAEEFIDRRDTSTTADLDQAGAEAVAAGVKPVTVAFVPLESDGQKFGRDWSLGDIVTVQAGGLTITDQIREIRVALTSSGVQITPSVGAPTGDLALFRTMAGLERRIRQLERI